MELLELQVLLFEASRANLGEQGFRGNTKLFRGARLVPFRGSKCCIDLESLDVFDSSRTDVLQSSFPGEVLPQHSDGHFAFGGAWRRKLQLGGVNFLSI